MHAANQIVLLPSLLFHEVEWDSLGYVFCFIYLLTFQTDLIFYSGTVRIPSIYGSALVSMVINFILHGRILQMCSCCPDFCPLSL